MSRYHEQSSPVKKIYGQEITVEIPGQTCPGILWGFCPFMNLVIDECVEMATSGQQNNTGMVAMRGNSVNVLEVLDQA